MESREAGSGALEIGEGLPAIGRAQQSFVERGFGFRQAILFEQELTQ